MVAPFVPGVSERLKTVAAKYGLSFWHTFPGKVQDLFTVHRGHSHPSKTKDCVYCTNCACGAQYVGETNRNLKVRLSEHRHNSSKSSLSLHIQDNKEDTQRHEIMFHNSFILARERNGLKRKITESLCIEHKAAHLVNTRTSIEIPAVWKRCAEALQKQLADTN